MRRFASIIAALALASAACTQGAGAQQLDATWDLFDFAHQRVDSASVSALSLDNLRHLRAIVFGKRGRPFTDDPELHRFLVTRPWYHADPAFRNKRLSAMERLNLDIIRGAEAHKHAQIETGDMRYFRSQPITVAMLGHHKAGDWDVLGAEVEAVHGKVMPGGGGDEADTTDADGHEVTYLQLYFTERYWYRADTSYSPARLSSVERANLDTITLARMLDLGWGVYPGAMYLFRDRLLDDSLLKSLTLYNLRLLRNEVYARNGRRFQTAWLSKYFNDQPWYKSRASFRDTDLSAIDTANINLIARVEARRHEELSTREMPAYELQGLYPEDARRLRNEIFARHGRLFKDRKLQAYFGSFSWYKADPQFDERSLSAIERTNIKAILDQESRAKKGERFTPG